MKRILLKEYSTDLLICNYNMAAARALVVSRECGGFNAFKCTDTDGPDVEMQHD